MDLNEHKVKNMDNNFYCTSCSTNKPVEQKKRVKNTKRYNCGSCRDKVKKSRPKLI